MDESDFGEYLFIYLLIGSLWAEEPLGGSSAPSSVPSGGLSPNKAHSWNVILCASEIPFESLRDRVLSVRGPHWAGALTGLSLHIKTPQPHCQTLKLLF